MAGHFLFSLIRKISPAYLGDHAARQTPTGPVEARILMRKRGRGWPGDHGHLQGWGQHWNPMSMSRSPLYPKLLAYNSQYLAPCKYLFSLWLKNENLLKSKKYYINAISALCSPLGWSVCKQCRGTTWTVDLSKPIRWDWLRTLPEYQGYPGTAALSIPWCSRTSKDKYA